MSTTWRRHLHSPLPSPPPKRARIAASAARTPAANSNAAAGPSRRSPERKPGRTPSWKTAADASRAGDDVIDLTGSDSEAEAEALLEPGHQATPEPDPAHQLRDTQTELAQAKEEVKRLTQQLVQRDLELATKTRELAESVSKLADTKDHARRQRTELNDLKAAKAAANVELREQAEALAKAEAAQKKAEKLADEHEKAAKTQANRALKAEKELEEKTLELAEAEQDLRRKTEASRAKETELGGLREAAGRAGLEMAEKNMQLAELRAELTLRDAQLAELGGGGAGLARAADRLPPTHAELAALRKANRRLTAQVSGQYRIMATLREQIRDTERRYDPLYPMEKAAVILGAVYRVKLRGKPAIWHRFTMFMRGTIPADLEGRLGVGEAALRAALAPLSDHVEVHEDRNTAAHPSRDMAHLLSWDLDRIRQKGALEDLDAHRVLVACAEAWPFQHVRGRHDVSVAAVEREKRAPPVIYIGDSDDEDEVVIVPRRSASKGAEKRPPASADSSADDVSVSLGRTSASLEEGEIRG